MIMQNNNDKKSIIGMLLFALSILMLIYMLISPLNQLLVNVEEYFTLTLINFPITDILTIAGSDINPPLYYLLAKVVSKFAGSIFTLKLLSIIPYAVIIIISAVKLRDDYGWLTAGLFAFAMAVSSEFFISFLQIRPYGWAILFIVLAFVMLRDVLDKNDNVSWVLFTLSCVLAAYTYYFAGITALCLYLVILIYILKFKSKDIKMWAISLAAFLILYIPWMFSLAKLLLSIHESFWIPTPSLDLIIQSLGYFAYTGDTLLSCIAILIAAIVGGLYVLNSDDSELDQFYVAGGILAFILTLIIGLVISFTFKPVLLSVCMIPAAALVWISISIMISKIQNRRFALIAGAFTALLLLCGVAGVIATSADLYDSGHAQSEVLDNITQDDNGIVILTTPNMIVHFLDYANSTDMYCVATDYIYGENIDRVHQVFDFKDIDKSKIKDFANNNSDKNIYLISWKEPDLDLNTTKLSDEDGVVISKVNVSKPESEEEYYEY